MKTVLFAALLVGCAVFSVTVKNDLLRERSPLQTLKLGEKMPDFTLKDASGADVALSAVLRDNKVVLINFWASWCGPCRLEMPSFEKLYQTKHAEGFVILAINEDEKRPDMELYLGKKPVTFPVLIDADSALMKRFEVRAMPTSILVGGDGRIRQVTEGIQEYLSMFVDTELKGPQVRVPELKSVPGKK